MKIIKNLITLAVFFIIFFILYFVIYFFKVLDTNNIYQNINADLIKNLMEHYFFAITIVAATSAMIVIGSLNKFVGNVSVVITIIVIAAVASIYPAYTVIFNKNIDYLRNELNDKSSLFIDENGKFLTKVDNYLIRVGYKLLDNTYKNAIFIDNTSQGKLYFSDYIYFTEKEISLHEVTEISGTTKTSKTSAVFPRNSLDNYISNFAADVIFGFEVFPIITAMLKIVTLSNIPPYAIIILFINFAVMFFSFYMLGLSLNSRQFIYHNILNAFVIYAVIKIIFAISIEHYNLLEFVVRNMNYWNMNIYLFSISLLIIVISLILKRILNNDKKTDTN
ncbi:hypothetical protein [Brachyspira murdochii]|uniref:Uncharacterized protein n=1 Tax=Brachyspira murdochii TaxID=84378 RepID=A0ABX5B4J8_9SPIR|nr:hypothetical protein [Brachyspira murdochii]PPS22080.1 hypothetical protein DJ52_07060 [Brachyspira murdochii]